MAATIRRSNGRRASAPVLLVAQRVIAIPHHIVASTTRQRAQSGRTFDVRLLLLVALLGGCAIDRTGSGRWVDPSGNTAPRQLDSGKHDAVDGSSDAPAPVTDAGRSPPRPDESPTGDASPTSDARPPSDAMAPAVTAPDATASGERTPCGSTTCDRATEVCVARVQLLVPTFVCRELSDLDCDSRSCRCLRDRACPEDGALCLSDRTSRDTNTVGCVCLDGNDCW